MEKEEVKNNEKIENNGVESGEVYERSAKFSEVGKEFVGPSEEEMTQEEEILKSTAKDVTEEEKKALIATLKHVEKWSEKYNASNVRWCF